MSIYELAIRDLNAAREQNKRLTKALRALVDDAEACARRSFTPPGHPETFAANFKQADPDGYAAWKEACAALKEAEEGK